MKREMIVGVLFTAAIVALGFGFFPTESSAAPAGTPSATLWEYRVLELKDLDKLTDPPSREVALNKLGGEGWELVAVTAQGTVAARTDPAKVYLKRRK